MDMTDPLYERPAEAAPAPRAKGRMLGPLILALLAFLIGLAAMAFVLTRWSAAVDYLGIRAASPAPQAPVAAAPPTAPTAPVPPAAEGAAGETLVLDPEVSRRVALLEERVTQIANQSQAAVGNADRAEGLLVAFAARRALDRGVALGYIEGLLRQRFGTSQPQAVGTIIAAAREPVTLQELQEGLREVGPSLSGPGPDRDWWMALKAELGGLVTVRKEGTPSTLPAERLQRARQRLEAGQVDVALAEVLRMPGREAAAGWIQDARRYVAARRALDTIETAALLEPRVVTAPAPATPTPDDTPSPTRPDA